LDGANHGGIVFGPYNFFTIYAEEIMDIHIETGIIILGILIAFICALIHYNTEYEKILNDREDIALRKGKK
jgi:hypothetical protein